MFEGSSVDRLTLTPSQYARGNCYLASELAPFDSEMIDFIGADDILWGSDYPARGGIRTPIHVGHTVGSARPIVRVCPRRPAGVDDPLLQKTFR
jgi:hypothetical protein